MAEEPKKPKKHPLRETTPKQQFVYVGDKEFKKLQKKAWEAGWWPKSKKNGIMWLSPNGKDHVTLHGTSSDSHAYDNAVAQFRAAGLAV